MTNNRNAETIGQVNDDWTFDPTREIWWARTGENTWSETPGSLDDPPSFSPEQI